MGAAASAAAVGVAQQLGCAPVDVVYANDASDAETDAEHAASLLRPRGSAEGWAGGLPDHVLARIFAAAERGATVFGSRPRADVARDRTTQQSYDLGAGVGAAGTLRLVCRAWRRVHDAGVSSLRPRALHAEALPAVFPWLTRLDLSRVPFPPLPALATSLSRLRVLITLTMRDNGAGHLAAATVASALKSPACRIAFLNLCENHVDDRGAVALAGALRHSRALTELNLRDNGLTDAGAIALAEALPGSCLTSLDLSGNVGIGVDACVALAHALTAPGAAAPRLRALSLGGCSVGDGGARVLGDALPHCTAPLQSLALFSAGVSDAGAVALASGLARNGTLTSLSLFGNAVSDAGAVALATSLRTNRSLAFLDLFDADVALSGACALADTLSAGGGASAALREVRLALPRGVDAEAAAALVARAGPRLITTGVRGRSRGSGGAGGAANGGAWRPHAAGLLAEDGALAAH
jgi:hypothetical protein